MALARGPGRPRKSRGQPGVNPRAGNLGRDAIVMRALELCRTESLAAISMVRVAESLGVQAGTIRHHVGVRDELLTGVINTFYSLLHERLKISGDNASWKSELRRIGATWFNLKLEYSGVTQYFATEDRYRIFQKPRSGERDHGAAFMDRVFVVLRNAGFTPSLAAECWHQLALATTAAANEISTRHSTGQNARFLLQRAQEFDHLAGLSFALPALAKLDAEAAFINSLDSLIRSFEERLRIEGPK